MPAGQSKGASGSTDASAPAEVISLTVCAQSAHEPHEQIRGWKDHKGDWMLTHTEARKRQRRAWRLGFHGHSYRYMLGTL